MCSNSRRGITVLRGEDSRNEVKASYIEKRMANLITIIIIVKSHG